MLCFIKTLPKNWEFAEVARDIMNNKPSLVC